MDVPSGYTLEDRSVPLTELPRWVLGLMLGLFTATLLLFWIAGGSIFYRGMAGRALLWIVVLTLAHEVTHAVFWKYASGLPWRTFRFGFAWKALSPYCHARAPMSVSAYRIGSMAPLFLTGLLPLVITLATLDGPLAVASAVLISGASGDLFVWWTIRDLPEDALVQDHDSQAGCLVLWPTPDLPDPDIA